MNSDSNTKPPYHLGVELGFLGLLALLWGSSYLFIRVAVETIPPVTLITLRVVIASTLLTSIVFLRGYKFPAELKMWGALFIQAGLNGFAAWTILAWGQQYIDSGLAAVLNSTTPIFVFFITFFITKHERLTWYKLAGAALGVLGVCLIVGVNVLEGLGQQVLGQLAALTGACLYAIGAINGKKFAKLPPVVTAASIMLLSALVFSCIIKRVLNNLCVFDLFQVDKNTWIAWHNQSRLHSLWGGRGFRDGFLG